LLSFPGRYAGPYLAERFGGIPIYATATLLSAGAVLVMIGGGTWRMPTHFVAFGITFGAMLPIRAVVMAHWFSGPGYGRMMGAQWSLAAVFGALMPAATGALRDQVGGYGTPLAAVSVLFAAAAVVAVLSNRIRARSERGGAAPEGGA
jgi:hypothetical protein